MKQEGTEEEMEEGEEEMEDDDWEDQEVEGEWSNGFTFHL